MGYEGAVFETTGYEGAIFETTGFEGTVFETTVYETAMYEPKELSELVMSIVKSRSKFTSDSYLHNKPVEMPSLGQSMTSIASDFQKKNLVQRALSLDKPYLPSSRRLNSNKLLTSDFFAPTDTQSLKSFRSNKPITVDNRSTYSLIGEDEHVERCALHDNNDDDDDFLVVDVNELADCDPELVMASPLYLPFLGEADKNNFTKNSLHESNRSLKSFEFQNEKTDRNEEQPGAIEAKKNQKPMNKFSSFFTRFANFFKKNQENDEAVSPPMPPKPNVVVKPTAPTKSSLKKPALPGSVGQPQLVLKQMGKGAGNQPRYIIASCNCRQRHVHAMSNKKRTKLNSLSADHNPAASFGNFGIVLKIQKI